MGAAMNELTRTVRSALLAAALVIAPAAAQAATFTFTPANVGLTGAAVTADNILVSPFSNLTFTGATTFTESGFLSITGFQLGGSNAAAGGLNGTYSLYFQFSETGQLTTGTSSTDPRAAATAGVLDTLTYSFIGASGNAIFGFSGLTPTVTPGGATQTLATGTLVGGSTATTPANGNTAFLPTEGATVTFTVAPGKQGFFSPNPFSDTMFITLASTVAAVQTFSGGGLGSGFLINNGDSTSHVNFQTAVPEPATWAMMLLGFAGLGFAFRQSRRKVSFA